MQALQLHSQQFEASWSSQLILSSLQSQDERHLCADHVDSIVDALVPTSASPRLAHLIANNYHSNAPITLLFVYEMIRNFGRIVFFSFSLVGAKCSCTTQQASLMRII